MKLLLGPMVAAAALFLGCAAEPAPGMASTSSSVSEARPGPAFTWPVPAGWRSETIPFPLGFAPSIPHQGIEELRFGPRFFDPTSPTYFTYSFAFVLDRHGETDGPITAESFAGDLRTYFHGLATAVTGAPSDASLHDATITRAKDGELRGTVHTIDAFGDRRPLTLRLEAVTFACGDRQVVIASLSPRSDAAIWTELAAVRASFACAR